MLWGIISPMKATLIQQLKRVHRRGVIEIAVWRVPEPVPPCAHSFKYRLVYVVGGRRLVGFDNERGKGDHRHDGRHESLYSFVDVETLLADFWQAVEEKGAGR